MVPLPPERDRQLALPRQALQPLPSFPIPVHVQHEVCAPRPIPLEPPRLPSASRDLRPAPPWHGAEGAAVQASTGRTWARCRAGTDGYQGLESEREDRVRT